MKKRLMSALAGIKDTKVQVYAIDNSYYWFRDTKGQLFYETDLYFTKAEDRAFVYQQHQKWKEEVH